MIFPGKAINESFSASKHQKCRRRFFMQKIEKLIKKYCGSLEDRFDACKDKKGAELLKERVFWEFKQADHKIINLSDVKDYLDKLINRKFTDERK